MNFYFSLEEYWPVVVPDEPEDKPEDDLYDPIELDAWLVERYKLVLAEFEDLNQKIIDEINEQHKPS